VIKYQYRLIIGERGNNQGHIISCRAKTEAGARQSLRLRMAKENYREEWGLVEYKEVSQNYMFWRYMHDSSWKDCKPID